MKRATVVCLAVALLASLSSSCVTPASETKQETKPPSGSSGSSGSSKPKPKPKPAEPPVVEPAPEPVVDVPADVVEVPPVRASCATTARAVKMYWKQCHAQVAGCSVVEGDSASGGGVFLQTPATGKVAREAHLLTTEDSFGKAGPSSSTDGLQAHLRRSQERSGHKLERKKPLANWAQASPSSKRFGRGSSGRIPVVDEAWYVTLYWRDKPKPGTRVIIRNPKNGRAVVAAAGWETGPASNARVAGASEEIHFHLGTTHDAVLEVGFAADAGLPLGPIDCAD